MKPSDFLYLALCGLEPANDVKPQATSEFCCLCLEVTSNNRRVFTKTFDYLKRFQPPVGDSWQSKTDKLTQDERFVAIYWCYLDALAEERTTKRAEKLARSRAHLATFNTTNK